MLEYTGHFGLAGSLVGAILQASGIISLHNLIIQAEYYFKALGVLFFVSSVIVIVTKLATGGNLKQAVLLLLGPLLGMTALFTTMPILLDEKKAEGRVSLETGVLSFFGEEKKLDSLDLPLVITVVNRVTKSVTSQLAEFILSDKLKEETVRGSRDRLMSRLLGVQNIDINYKLLLTLSLSGDCAEITANDWELSRAKYQTAPPGSINAKLAEQLRAKREALKLKRHRIEQRTIDYLSGLGVTAVATPTCDEIWLYSRDASFKLADMMLSNASTYRSEFPELTDAEWIETLTFVKEKLSPSNTTEADWNQAYRILAAFLLRNTLQSSAHGAMSGSFSSHSNWMLEKEEEGDWDLGSLEGSVDSIQMTVVRFAAAVPYVQGLCFYLLLVSYPFFCLLMIFPQKIGSLVTWASLWLWLCSWEVGFAIVSLVKETLWQTLPHIGDQILPSETGLPVSRLVDVNWADPASMFNLLTAESPEQHFQTYYGLIATLTLAVPVLTGYCFQAASQFADIIQRAWTPGGGRVR